MKLLKNMENTAGIVIETLYHQMNMSLLVFMRLQRNLIESMNSVKYNRKKTNFINRLKCAEHKYFCICVDVYEVYEGDDSDKIYEVLSTLKNKKIKINSILIEKYKDMLKNPDFEQNHWSRTAIGINKMGHDSIS